MVLDISRGVTLDTTTRQPQNWTAVSTTTSSPSTKLKSSTDRASMSTFSFSSLIAEIASFNQPTAPLATSTAAGESQLVPPRVWIPRASFLQEELHLASTEIPPGFKGCAMLPVPGERLYDLGWRENWRRLLGGSTIDDARRYVMRCFLPYQSFV
jgi:hypothetical protein